MHVPTHRLWVVVTTTAHLVVDVVGDLPAESRYQAVAPARLPGTRSGFETVDGEFEHDPGRSRR